jgi:hypothetical protein
MYQKKKDESVVETEPKETNQETKTTDQETKPAEKSDGELEEYSKGVQNRIARLTRKMREAERREKSSFRLC